MNRIFCVFLLFAISCANWILASQQPCPDLSLYRIIDKHSHANGAIMLCHSPANFSFSITSDELKKLQNTPNKSPATGIYSTQRDNQCVGIIIPTNVIDDLRKVTNYSREKESPSTFNFYLINALSPGTIWNKTDSQKQNSH